MDAPAWSLKARWVLPVLTPPVENGVIEIAGDTIVAVRQGGPATHDLGDSILIPGLVNAHTHLDLTGFPRPVTPPPTFADWITQVIQHRLRETPEQRLMAIRKGVRQSMAHGVTLLGDISSNGASSQVIASESVAATVYHEILGLNLERANQTRSAAANWLSSQSSANVLPAISPHAPYSTRRNLYAWAQSLPVPVQTHLAESFEEIALITHGSGPLAKMLHDLKLLPTENMPQGVNDVLRLLASQRSPTSLLDWSMPTTCLWNLPPAWGQMSRSFIVQELTIGSVGSHFRCWNGFAPAFPSPWAPMVRHAIQISTSSRRLPPCFKCIPTFHQPKFLKCAQSMVRQFWAGKAKQALWLQVTMQIWSQ